MGGNLRRCTKGIGVRLELHRSNAPAGALERCSSSLTPIPRVQRRRFPPMESENQDRVRLDKWLWAARFFKTRGMAAEAIDGGKVEVNDGRAKRAKMVQLGDRVRIRQTPFEHVVV